MDSFLIQGPKVLIRVGLVVFNHFAEYNQSRGLYIFYIYWYEYACTYYSCTLTRDVCSTFRADPEIFKRGGPVFQNAIKF